MGVKYFVQEKWGTTHPIINRTMFSSICVPHSCFIIICVICLNAKILSQQKFVFDILELNVLVLREKVELGKHSGGCSVVMSHDIFYSAHHLREVQQDRLPSVCASGCRHIKSILFKLQAS